MSDSTATPAIEEPAVERVAASAVPAVSSGGALALPAVGVYALATMSDAEFATRLTAMQKGRERVQQIQRALMTEGVHYGKPPGREKDPEAKPGLLKAGAEVLCNLYGYVPDAIIESLAYGDPLNTTSPAIRVRVRCEMHAGTLAGPVVGVGYGAANTWEVKYRWRQAARECPSCKKTTIMRSKFEAKGGDFKGTRPWYCNAKAGGCGEEFDQDDARLKDQVTGRVTNEDAQDLENTLVKMAEKRAKVDATIAATAASDLFTQDVEDMGGEPAIPWEAAKQDGAPNPTSATARPAVNGTDLPASDGQIKFVRSLMSKKLGIAFSNDARIFMELQERKWATAWPCLAREASVIIAALKDTPDKAAGASVAPAASEPGPAPAPAQLRIQYLAGINALVQKIHHVQPSRDFFVEHEGLQYLVDLEALKVLDFKDIKAVDELSLDELVRLGKWLRFQPGAAPPSPAPAEGRAS